MSDPETMCSATGNEVTLGGLHDRLRVSKKVALQRTMAKRLHKSVGEDKWKRSIPPA